MGDLEARRPAAWRFVRAVVRAQRHGVTGAVLSGLLWQTGAVAAPLVVKYAIDHGIVAARPPRAARLAVRAARRRAARGLRRRLPPPVRDPQPLALRRGRPRRALRARAAARRDLPRPRRPGRAAEPRLVGLAAHRADDGRDRPHDRLRAHRRRGRDRDADPRLAARARGADPGAVRDRRRLALLAQVRQGHPRAAGELGARRRRSSRRPSAASASSRGSAPATRCPLASAAAASRSWTARSRSRGSTRSSSRCSRCCRCSGSRPCSGSAAAA